MTRVLVSGMLLLVFGCAVPAERVSLQALPENGQVLPYPELLTRIRAQARAANDAYYLDSWGDLEDLAKGIEQTSRFLAKAKEVPKKNRDILNEVTGDLAKNAIALREAAVSKNTKQATTALQQIISKVHELRLSE